MDDEAQVAHYDPVAGVLRVRLSGGEEVRLAGLHDLSFRRSPPGEAATVPLWLSPQQADVLGKMIAHILANVRISATSRQVLEELRQPVEDVKDELAGAAESPEAGAEPAAR